MLYIIFGTIIAGVTHCLAKMVDIILETHYTNQKVKSTVDEQVVASLISKGLIYLGGFIAILILID